MKPEERTKDIKVIEERVQETPEMSEWITRLETEAEQDIAAATVTFHWGKEQVEVVKRAAALIGVPYQAYLKQVVFRQAVADIKKAESVVERAG